MNQLLYAALVLVLSLQPNLLITHLDTPVVTNVQRMADGSTVTTSKLGWAECELTTTDGVGTWRVLRIVYTDGYDTLTHEALHAADCMDNGRTDGSLLPFKPTGPDPAHEWVYWALDHPDEAVTLLNQQRMEKYR